MRRTTTEQWHVHRNITGGAARAAVFGMSDGLTTNVALILGVAGANPAAGVVRLAGVAGLIGGAFSMAAGEWVSMRAQAELLERELDVERQSLQASPEHEERELVGIYRSRGIDHETAAAMASQVMADPDRALEVHAREELGVNPGALGSPVSAALSSFATFAVGALIPLVPWLFGHGRGMAIISVALAAVAALIVGGALSRFTGKGVVFSALRQLGIAAVASAVTFGLGVALGAGH